VSAVLRYREILPPVTSVPEVGWVAVGERSGITANLFRSEITFKQSMNATSLTLVEHLLNASLPGKYLAYKRAADAAPVVIDLSVAGNTSISLAVGDWFAFYGSTTSSSNVFLVRSQPVRLDVAAPTNVYVRANWNSSTVTAGETRVWELFSLSIPMDVPIRNTNAITSLLAYLEAPTGAVVLDGDRTTTPGFFEVRPKPGAAAARVRIPKPTSPTPLSIPLRVSGLNPNWTAGVYQLQGYVLGNHSNGTNRYRETAVDAQGYAYVPMHVNLAKLPSTGPYTDMIVGHPVAADSGNALIIRVTHLYDSPAHWYVSVNNPTSAAITTTLRQKIAGLPGLNFATTTLTLQPGELRVLRAN
jgi:hypothetical protein